MPSFTLVSLVVVVVVVVVVVHHLEMCVGSTGGVAGAVCCLTTFIGLPATPHSRQSFLGGGEILFLCFIKTIRNINLASQTVGNVLYHISYQTHQTPTHKYFPL